MILKNYIKHYQGLPKGALYALLTIFTYSLGFATIVFLPIYLHLSLQHSLVSTGFAISAYGVGTIVASYQGGKLCDRFSARTVTMWSLIFSTLFLVLLYFVHAPYSLLIVLLVFMGMANAAFLPASRIYLMRLTPPTDQARANGIRYMIWNVGAAASLVFAGWFIGNQSHYTRVFILSAAVSLLSLIALLIFCKKEQFERSIHKKRHIDLWQDKFLLLIFIYYFLGMLIFVQLNSVYNLYLFIQYQTTNHQLSSLYALNCLMVAFLQVFIIQSLQGKSQIVVMSFGIATIGLGFFILLFGHNYGLAVLSMMIITLGEMMFMPLSQNIIYQRAKNELKGYYMGVYQALYSVTLLVSPFGGSLLLKVDPSGRVLWSLSFGVCILPLLSYFFLRLNKNFSK